ncbi:sulfite exporter TauE/SafE family protein [Microbacterium sp. 1P10UB]|uniref:sulfite exporter TauE/SafE family protein n=1 Tax=unclassified Microbacterium TaxID=2609290 RepID=UPI00399FC1BA
MLPDLPAFAWLLLALAAVTVGLSKTAIPGAGTVPVALFAAILPARQSTGTLLLLLITADAFAITMYRRNANWGVLLRLVPAVLLGVGLGVAFLAVASDGWVKRLIGVILLVVVGVTLYRRWVQSRAVVGPDGDAGGAVGRRHPVAAAVYGSLGGFTTMVANAGGPVMSMYLLAMRFPVKEFLGTAAWFFAIINLCKVPFSAGLGLITVPGLWVDLVLAPAVVIGALCGRWLASRLNQRLFERLVIVFTVVGAVYLLV